MNIIFTLDKMNLFEKSRNPKFSRIILHAKKDLEIYINFLLKKVIAILR